jgi:hypothetical protein
MVVDGKGGRSMVTVTEEAMQELRNVLAGTSTKPDQALRLVPRSGGGFGLGLDEEREGDQVVAEGDDRILLLAPTVVDALGEATIATQDTEEGRKLVISRE